MTGLENAAYAALLTVIQAAYPALTTVLREEQIGRADWENLVVTGSLVAPFALVRAGPSEPQDWGLDNWAFRWSITVTFVVSIADVGAASDITGYLLQQLGSLRAALIDYSGGAFQLAGDHPTITASVRTEINQLLLNHLAGFQAGELSADLLIGQSPA